MASGSQNMTTYNARTVTGSNSAASPAGALLLSGADRADNATGDTWIFLDSAGGTSTPWGIKHDQANNKIQIFGAGTNSVWTEMDTGNTYIGGSLNTGSTLIVRAQDNVHEGGEIILSPATDSFSTVYIDACDNLFRVHDGTNVHFRVNVSTGNATVMGKLGINYDSETSGNSYQLYVNGTSNFSDTIFFHKDGSLQIFTQTNSQDYADGNTENVCIQTSFDDHDYTYQYFSTYLNRVNLLLQPKGGQVYIGLDLTNLGDTNYKLYVNGNTYFNGNTTHNGNLIFSNSGTAFRGINYGTMGDNDQWRIGGAATASNAGYMEIATADDGNEPIYIRQYTGVFSSVKRTLTLLDANGYMLLPSYINVPTSNSENPTVSQFIVTNGSDSYYRKASTTHVMAAIRGAASGTWGISISGNANSANSAGYTSHLLGVNTSNTPYGYSEGNIIRAVWNVYSDSRWYFRAGSYQCRVDYANTSASCAGNSNTADYQNCVATNEIRYARNGNMQFASDLWQGWAFAEGQVAVINGWRFGNGNGGLAPIYGSKVYNAVWNDFAEYRVSDITEGGRVLVSDGKGHLILSTERLQPSARVISDTFGCSVGMSDSAKTPIGVAGRVLVYPYQPRENYKVGDALCAAPNGTADIMTREEIIQYPDRIIGIVDEVPDYEIWDQVHTNKKDDGEVGEQNHTNIEVNGRIWIYVR